MSAEKTLAIVLRVVEFSETSCVVTLYTRDFGKIGALAKGARRRGVPGGAGGTRTPDFRLAKAALSQLSYGPTCAGRLWWAMVDSNHRPRSYQDRALTS